MIPAYRILADAVDVTDAIRGNLVEIRITDKDGVDADEVELVISDPSGRIAMPKRGVQIRPALGWLGQALVEKGGYSVDEVEHQGPPDQIRVKGRGVAMTSKLTEAREASYHEKTVGEILQTVAARQDLKLACDPQLAGIKIPHLDQTRESDMHFVTRLGLDLDAIATVKDGRLVFVPAGAGTDAAGQKLPAATIVRTAKIQHRLTIKDREASATGAKAQYRDLEEAVTKEVDAGSTSDGKPNVTLKRVYASEEEAKVAAAMALKSAQRKLCEITLDLAVGRPELVAGQPLTLKGWRPEIDGMEWVIEEVVHSLTNQALTTSIKANSGKK